MSNTSNTAQAFTLPSMPASIALKVSLSSSSSTPSSPTSLCSKYYPNDNDDNSHNYEPKYQRGGKKDQIPTSPSTSTSTSTVNDTKRRQALFKALSIPSSLFLSNKILPIEPSYADIEGVVTPSFLSDPNVNALPSSATSTNLNPSSSGVTLFKTKSGLQYIELEKGTGPSPNYGNFVTISYKAYVKLPDGNTKNLNSSLQEYDSDSSYLVKHGNGRMIPGLDEGLHTMKVGGKRRVIIPAKLGYVGPGVLGPLPDSPYGRYRLNKLLDSMVEVRGGNVIFDVELKSVVVDEADQGYYEDDSLTPEQFNALRVNLQQQAKTAKAQGIGNGFDLLDEI